MRMTPYEEATYALHYGVRRADLKPDVQAVYDRLLEERQADAARPWAGTLVPISEAGLRAGEHGAPGTWQGLPLQRRWQLNWPVWLFIAGPCCVVLAFIVGAFGGSNVNDAANLTAAALFVFGLVAVFVAIPGMVHRHSRARRMATPPQRSPFAYCYGCRYPLAVHFGDRLQCPLDGICYRCGQPLTLHTGYELTCPGSQAPHCFRCGQPPAAHVGDGLVCPAPWVLAS